MPAVGRLSAMIVFLLSELHASCLARGTHGIRNMSEEVNAHRRFDGDVCHSIVLGMVHAQLQCFAASQKLRCAMEIKPHTLLEPVCRSFHWQ